MQESSYKLDRVLERQSLNDEGVATLFKLN